METKHIGFIGAGNRWPAFLVCAFNIRALADSEREWHPRGESTRHFLWLIVGLSLATSCGAAVGHAQMLPREDNIWGGSAHQPTLSQVTQQEQSASIAASRQEQQLDNEEVESIYAKLMRETAPRS